MQVQQWTVQDVQRHLCAESWVDFALLRTLNTHAIDGPALMELTSDDLRYDFHITDALRRQEILDGIHSIRNVESPSLVLVGEVGKQSHIEDMETTLDHDAEVRSVLHRYRVSTPTNTYYRPSSSILKDNIPRACSTLATRPVTEGGGASRMNALFSGSGGSGGLPAWARLEDVASLDKFASSTPAVFTHSFKARIIADEENTSPKAPPTKKQVDPTNLQMSDVPYPKMVLIAPVIGPLEKERRREVIDKSLREEYMARGLTPTSESLANDFRNVWEQTSKMDNVMFDRHMKGYVETNVGSQSKRQEYSRRCLALQKLYEAYRGGSAGVVSANVLYECVESMMAFLATPSQSSSPTRTLATSPLRKIKALQNQIRPSPHPVDVETFCEVLVRGLREAIDTDNSPELFDTVLFHLHIKLFMEPVYLQQKKLTTQRKSVLMSIPHLMGASAGCVPNDPLCMTLSKSQPCVLLHSTTTHATSTRASEHNPFLGVRAYASSKGIGMDHVFLTPQHRDESVRMTELIKRIRSVLFSPPSTAGTLNSWLYITMSYEYCTEEKENVTTFLRELGLMLAVNM
eukprot:PhF_6_TR11681/c0_g1_i2/m.18929